MMITCIKKSASPKTNTNICFQVYQAFIDYLRATTYFTIHIP